MNKKQRIITCIFLFIISLLFANESWKIFDDYEVAIIEISVDEASLNWMYNNVWSDSIHNATIHFQNQFIDETIENVGFRLRGNTSRISQKKSFKLDFNSLVPGRKFYDIEKLNLNGEHNDPSIIRSKLCWDIFENIGQISSAASHVAVYINDQYYGLYIMLEHIDDEFLNKNYSDDTGNLWKCHYLARLTYLGNDPEAYKFEQNGSRVYELKTNTEEDDYSQLVRLIDIINNTPNYLMADSLESIVNIPSVLKYLAINVLTGSWDDYWNGKSNYYIYHEPAEDLFHIIPYDYDNTFGVDWMNIDWTQRDVYQFKHPDADRPLADVFMENSQYRNLYSHFLEFYHDNTYELSNWESRIDSLKDMITYWAEIDSFRTYDYGFTVSDFHDSYSENSYQNQHVKNGLKEFINLRNSSMLQQLEYLDSDPVIYDFSWVPHIPQPEDTIYIQLSAFSHIGLDDVSILFYPEESTEPINYEMTYQPIPNTNLVEEADRWIGFVPPLGLETYGYFEVIATDLNGNSQAFPRSERIYVETNSTTIDEVVINEFLAINNSVNMDNFGEFDDWIELYNPSTENIDLSGSYLTDGINNLTKWQFPDNTMIQAQDFLLIWCDEDGSQGSLHANFKLSGSGEFIALVAANGVTIVDSISFALQNPDISFGRYPDAAEDWGFMQPTPQSSNLALSSDSVIDFQTVMLSNYPNPFNPSTVISFSIKEAGRVSINIYNIKGQLVKTLVNKHFEAAFYSIIWNGTDSSNKVVSSGIYFYKMKSGNYTLTKKMVLMK